MYPRRETLHRPNHQRGEGEWEVNKPSFTQQIISLDLNKCRRKGCRIKSNLEVHHIIPRSQGGPDDEWNLITLCRECHRAITENKVSDYTLLTELKGKGFFRWEKALEWHTTRKQLKDLRIKK